MQVAGVSGDGLFLGAHQRGAVQLLDEFVSTVEVRDQPVQELLDHECVAEDVLVAPHSRSGTRWQARYAPARLRPSHAVLAWKLHRRSLRSLGASSVKGGVMVQGFHERHGIPGKRAGQWVLAAGRARICAWVVCEISGRAGLSASGSVLCRLNGEDRFDPNAQSLSVDARERSWGRARGAPLRWPLSNPRPMGTFGLARRGTGDDWMRAVFHRFSPALTFGVIISARHVVASLREPVQGQGYRRRLSWRARSAPPARHPATRAHAASTRGHGGCVDGPQPASVASA